MDLTRGPDFRTVAICRTEAGTPPFCRRIPGKPCTNQAGAADDTGMDPAFGRVETAQRRRGAGRWREHLAGSGGPDHQPRQRARVAGRQAGLWQCRRRCRNGRPHRASGWPIPAAARTRPTFCWPSRRSACSTRAASTPSSSPRQTAISAIWRITCANGRSTVVGMGEAKAPDAFRKACSNFVELVGAEPHHCLDSATETQASDCGHPLRSARR